MRLLTLATAAAFLAAACGDSETTKQEQPGPKIVSRTEALFKSGPIGDPADPFAEVGETVVEVVPKAAGYDLPLDLAQVANLDRDIRGKDIHAVDGDAATKLAANGFVVVPTPHRMQRFSDAYEWLEQSDVPIVVTTDSTLHLYHLFFGQILKYLEATEFVPLLE